MTQLGHTYTLLDFPIMTQSAYSYNLLDFPMMTQLEYSYKHRSPTMLSL